MTNLILVVVFILIISMIFFLSMASGEKAIEKMNKEEKKYFEEKIVKIEIGVLYEEVKNILGSPSRGEETKRPTWKVLSSKGASQVAIYLSDTNTVSKIKWMKIGKFVWEKDT